MQKNTKNFDAGNKSLQKGQQPDYQPAPPRSETSIKLGERPNYNPIKVSEDTSDE